MIARREGAGVGRSAGDGDDDHYEEDDGGAEGGGPLLPALELLGLTGVVVEGALEAPRSRARAGASSTADSPPHLNANRSMASAAPSCSTEETT